MPQVGDLAVNLLASVISGAAVLLFEVVRRRRKVARKRRFFGLDARSACVLYIPRHASSGSMMSVHRRDAAAVVEVAAAARDCGAEIELALDAGDSSLRRLGDQAEFCIGGPDSTPRTSAHLETFLPGVIVDGFESAPEALTIRVGDHEFDRVPDKAEYVVLAKVTGSDRPVFVLCGQTAVANHAAARYLARRHVQLARQHGVQGRFCLVLKVVNSWAFGERKVECQGDFTRDAFAGGEGGT